MILLYIAVGSWNSFFNALIYLSNQKLYPLQLILREVLLAGQTIQSDVDAADIAEMQRLAATIKYAVMVISTLPIMAYDSGYGDLSLAAEIFCQGRHDGEHQGVILGQSGWAQALLPKP